MKKGFTLAELLITLGIVGVIAAVTVPTVAKLKPDNAKAKFLKSYAVLTDVTAELVNDESLFVTIYSSDGVTPACVGLACTNVTTDALAGYGLSNVTYLSTPAKYGYLLAWKLNALSTYSQSGALSVANFTTHDGVKWNVKPSTSTNSDGSSVLTANITIDIDGANKGKNCSFSTSCKNPDQFLFSVDTYGKVSPNDSLGKTFLKNSLNLQASNKDRANTN